MNRLALTLAACLLASPAAASAGLELRHGCWWRQDDNLHWIKVDQTCRPNANGGQTKAAPTKPKDKPKDCKPSKGHGKDKGHGGKDRGHKGHGKGRK